MTAAILSIGTELTRGELVNTNAPWLAAQLTELGFDLVAVDTVKDARADIVAALKRLSATSKVLVVTGGLGPTTDDITSECVAEAMGVKLARHEASLDAIRRRFEKLGREMSPSNEKQADFPEGADVLPNANGTAPAFAVFLGDCRAFFMPGVPREMKAIYETLVAPRLRPVAVIDSHQIRLRTFGLPESTVGERLAGLEEANPGLTIGYRASFPEIEVKVHVRARTGDEARTRASIVADEVRNRLGQYVFGEGDDTFPEAVGRAFRARGFRLAVAESCTGGLVGHLITSVPAASDYFVADAVTYANSAKTRLLGVNEETLRGHGAVSAEVAAEMAEGIRRVGEVDVGLSITGIAGPTGGSPEKPVGLVYWGISTARGTVVKSRTLFGDRSMIQRLAAYVGLQLVREAAMLDERSSTHVRAAEPVELAPASSRGVGPARAGAARSDSKQNRSEGSMLHHRTNVRAQTDVPVDVHADGFVFSCRAVDLSTSGALIDRAPGLEHHEARPFYWLRFGVGAHGVMTLARPVWKRGLTQAFRFVEMSDEGRLTLAEHMDVAHRLFGRALH
jgi:nicotinamide-nucleotide amidase